MPDILHQIVIAAPPAAVYRALTEPDGLAGWWTADVEAEPELGTVASFGFDDRSTVFKMKIEELTDGEFVRWHCVGGHPEWEHTEITFDLSPGGLAAGDLSPGDASGGGDVSDDGTTTLYFAHRGWESTDGILAACSFDWARYLMSLQAFLETGTGQPHTGKADPPAPA